VFCAQGLFFWNGSFRSLARLLLRLYRFNLFEGALSYRARDEKKASCAGRLCRIEQFTSSIKPKSVSVCVKHPKAVARVR